MNTLPSTTLAIERDDARDASPRALERHVASLRAELARTCGRSTCALVLRGWNGGAAQGSSARLAAQRIHIARS